MSKTIKTMGGVEKEEWRDRCSGERKKEVREKEEFRDYLVYALSKCLSEEINL